MIHRIAHPLVKFAAARTFWLPLWLLMPVLLVSRQPPDSVQAGEPPDTALAMRPYSAVATPLFHQPPVAILNDRPFIVDFFVDFDPDSIAAVSLLYRSDSSSSYTEVFLPGEYGRYQYRLPVEQLRGDALTYYFLVTMKDYRLWGYPTGEGGRIEPFVIDLVPPTREFFQKRYYD